MNLNLNIAANMVLTVPKLERSSSTSWLPDSTACGVEKCVLNRTKCFAPKSVYLRLEKTLLGLYQVKFVLTKGLDQYNIIPQNRRCQTVVFYLDPIIYHRKR